MVAGPVGQMIILTMLATAAAEMVNSGGLWEEHG